MTLGTYTKALQNRLNNEALQNDENDFIKIYDGCINEYLENRDNHFLDVFLATASDEYVDLHAKLFGLSRRESETDDELRQRVLLEETIVQSTSDFLKLNIGFWIFKDGVTDKNTLTSRNVYLKDKHDEGYVFIASGTDSDYIKSKFILEDILWLP